MVMVMVMVRKELKVFVGGNIFFRPLKWEPRTICTKVKNSPQVIKTPKFGSENPIFGRVW
jgi:hypothetical protein